MCKYFLEPKSIWDLVSISPTPTILFSFFVLPVWFWFWYNIFSPDSQTSFPTLLRFQKTNLFRRARAGAQQQLVVWGCQVKGHAGRPRGTTNKKIKGHDGREGPTRKTCAVTKMAPPYPRQNIELYRVVHVWETETRFCENVTVLKINILELCMTSIRLKVEEIETHKSRLDQDTADEKSDNRMLKLVRAPICLSRAPDQAPMGPYCPYLVAPSTPLMTQSSHQLSDWRSGDVAWLPTC